MHINLLNPPEHLKYNPMLLVCESLCSTALEVYFKHYMDSLFEKREYTKLGLQERNRLKGQYIDDPETNIFTLMNKVLMDPEIMHHGRPVVEILNETKFKCGSYTALLSDLAVRQFPGEFEIYNIEPQYKSNLKYFDSDDHVCFVLTNKQKSMWCAISPANFQWDLTFIENKDSEAKFFNRLTDAIIQPTYETLINGMNGYGGLAQLEGGEWTPEWRLREINRIQVSEFEIQPWSEFNAY